MPVCPSSRKETQDGEAGQEGAGVSHVAGTVVRGQSDQLPGVG